MTIQKAGNKDISQITALVNSAYRGEEAKKGWTNESDLLVGGIRVTEEDVREIITSPETMILKYEEHGQIFACVYLEEKQDYLYLGMLTVSPLLQGRGIGKLLMAAAEEQARNLGKKSIRLTVISVRSELKSWYERHGYLDTGKRIPFPIRKGYGVPSQPLEFAELVKEIPTAN